MARKTSYGTFIISAGEIGAYTVCPESWRLSQIEQVKPEQSTSARRGRKLHKEWASDYNESVHLARSVKLIVMLIVITIIIGALTLTMQ